MPGLISLRRAAGFFQSDNRNRSISSPGCCYARVLLGLANLVAELGPEISVLQGTQQRAVHGAGVAAWDESSVIATQGGLRSPHRVSQSALYVAQHAQKRALAAGLPLTLQVHGKDPTVRQQCFKFSFSNIPVHHGTG